MKTAEADYLVDEMSSLPSIIPQIWAQTNSKAERETNNKMMMMMRNELDSIRPTTMLKPNISLHHSLAS